LFLCACKRANESRIIETYQVEQRLLEINGIARHSQTQVKFYLKRGKAKDMAHPDNRAIPPLEQAADGIKRKTWILPFSLLLFVISVDSIDANSFGPVMAQIKSAWKMTNTNVGIYTGMYGLISILVAVPVGEAVRRWGVKRAVMGAVTIIFLGSVLMATADAFPQGLTGRAFASAGIRMATVASWAGASTVAPASVMTSAWTIMNTANAAGAIVGPSIVGGYVGSSFGWQAVFFTVAGFSAFCFVLIGLFLRMPPSRAAAPDGTAAPKVAPGFSVYRCWDIYLIGLIFTFMIGSSQVSIMSFAPLAMAQRWNMNPQAIGNVLGLSYSVGLPVMFIAGILADKLRTRKKIMIAAGVPMAAGLFMLTSQDQTIFTLGLIGYLGFTYAPGAMLYACAPGMVPRGTNLGPVYGLLATISNAGSFLAPIAVGRIRDATGDFNSSFILLGMLSMLSLILCFKLRVR
jgi:predicted MFS family arabinose efflux permease